MTYDDQLKSDEKHPFWSNPLLYKQGGTTQENTGQDTPAFDSQTTGGEKLRLIFDGTSSEEPVISLLALNCGITANILYANTKDVGGRIYGEMVVRVPADGASVGKAERFLAGKGVIVKEER